MTTLGATQDVASVARLKNEYLTQFSQLFEEELVEIHETSTSPEVVRQLAACVEAGSLVWGVNLQISEK